MYNPDNYFLVPNLYSCINTFPKIHKRNFIDMLCTPTKNNSTIHSFTSDQPGQPFILCSQQSWGEASSSRVKPPLKIQAPQAFT